MDALTYNDIQIAQKRVDLAINLAVRISIQEAQRGERPRGVLVQREPGLVTVSLDDEVPYGYIIQRGMLHR